MAKRKEREKGKNRIVFLGTGGARIVVFSQIRASGGLWFSLEGLNFHLDPGPGALVRCLAKKLKPQELDAIILSHKHLDHSADANVMIEAMTNGGFKKRGVLLVPTDALNDDPVILKYARSYVNEIKIIEEGKVHKLGDVEIGAPVRHIHGSVETYGLNFKIPTLTISYIADTRYFPGLADHYQGDLAIINVVRLEPSQIDHLSIEDVKNILKVIKPKLTVLNHFGMTLIRANPFKVAEQLSSELGLKVVAAYDGLELELTNLS